MPLGVVDRRWLMVEAEEGLAEAGLELLDGTGVSWLAARAPAAAMTELEGAASERRKIAAPSAPVHRYARMIAFWRSIVAIIRRIPEFDRMLKSQVTAGALDMSP